jgi:hypothetical protein
MRQVAADGLILVGALIAVGGAIKAAFAYVRFFPQRDASAADRTHRAIAGMEFVYSTSLAAVITGGGIVVLVVGLVIGYGAQPWTISMPAALMAGGALNAVFSRRTLERLRRPAKTS